MRKHDCPADRVEKGTKCTSRARSGCNIFTPCLSPAAAQSLHICPESRYWATECCMLRTWGSSSVTWEMLGQPGGLRVAKEEGSCHSKPWTPRAMPTLPCHNLIYPGNQKLGLGSCEAGLEEAAAAVNVWQSEGLTPWILKKGNQSCWGLASAAPVWGPAHIWARKAEQAAEVGICGSPSRRPLTLWCSS